MLEKWNQKLVPNGKLYMTNFMKVESVLVEIIIVKKRASVVIIVSVTIIHIIIDAVVFNKIIHNFSVP
jgi:hypothetical protein